MINLLQVKKYNKIELNGEVQGTAVDSIVKIVLQHVYPVGSIYTSMIKTSPDSILGFGTWTPINNKFMFCLDQENGFEDPIKDEYFYESNKTSGEDKHQLITDELPKHDHNTTSDAGYYLWGGNGNTNIQGGQGFSQSGSTIKTSQTGQDKAHNNMPPYITVFAWQRIK